MNKAIITGRLVSDPDVAGIDGGVARAKFRVAVRREYKDRQTGQYESDFLDCVAWKQTAEYVGQYIRKGMMVGLDGRIQTRNYTKDDGTKVYVTEIVAEHVESLTPRESAPTAPAGPAEPSYGVQREGAKITYGAPTGKQVTFTEVQDDELPF